MITLSLISIISHKTLGDFSETLNLRKIRIYEAWIQIWIQIRTRDTPFVKKRWHGHGKNTGKKNTNISIYSCIVNIIILLKYPEMYLFMPLHFFTKDKLSLLTMHLSLFLLPYNQNDKWKDNDGSGSWISIECECKKLCFFYHFLSTDYHLFSSSLKNAWFNKSFGAYSLSNFFPKALGFRCSQYLLHILKRRHLYLQ